MGVGDFVIRTGLRAEYDDFTKDVNIAPRFTTSWDLFGNGGSVITVGANRYYGRNILTYALYKAQNGGMENIYDYASDDSPAADGWFAANDFDGLERLKTSFSDEFSIGLTQRLGDWSASAATCTATATTRCARARGPRAAATTRALCASSTTAASPSTIP